MNARNRTQAVYVISVAAELAGMHPQTLRIYERRGLVNHLQAKIRDMQLGPSETVAQNASQCFDISIWQLLAALRQS